MKFSKAYLKKLIRDQIEEGTQIEYKAAGALVRNPKIRDEITKDISAFANATGGVLIYGMKEASQGDSPPLPDSIDPINVNNFSREWVDQMIGQVQPRIQGLIIHPIHVGPKKSDYCYVIEIPQSDTAHQAKDCRYYKRRNFESTMMEDYEIRDVMNRRKHPKLELDMRFADSKFRDEMCIEFRIRNVSNVIAKNYLIAVRFPAFFKNSHCSFPDKKMHLENGKYLWFLNVTNGLNAPLFPKSVTNREQKISFDYGASFPREKSIDKIEICIFADEMERIELEKDPEKVANGWA